jgi:radical SAM superfamily enzyme YgiQ (UPF0313 family)
MKVLLVQSHLGRIKHFPPLFPIGLSYIATALEKHRVKIFDLNFWETPLAYEMLEKEIAEFNPDVVGISIRNIDTTNRVDIFYHYKTIKPTVDVVKRAKPDVILIAGGAGFSMFAEQILNRIPEFDFGIYQEGEESVPELLDFLDSPEKVNGVFFRRDGDLHFTGRREPPDINKLPIARRDKEIIDISAYIGKVADNIGIQTKRGCALSCAYCSYPFLNGTKMRLRLPKLVVDEIEYLMSLGVKRFSFVDNIFNVPESHAREICEEIIRRGIKVSWSAWYEIKNTNESLIRLAQKAGCKHFGFSPDAATDRTLTIMKKGITVKDIEDNLRLVRKIDGIRAAYNLFFIIPGATLIDLIKVVILYFKIPIVLLGKGGGVLLSWIRLEHHTEVLQMAIDEGFISNDNNLLPEREEDLKPLFYTNPSYRYFEAIIIQLVSFMEKVIKPTAKFLLGYL